MTDFDVIVVGAGMGGLTAAAFLSAAGRRVLLLEQYSVLGGASHVFRRRNKWEFEVGVHYIGDCGPGGQVPRLLRGLAVDDRISFLPLDRDGFDTLCFPGGTFRVPFGWERYLNALIAAFPHEERALRRCVGVLAALGGALDRSESMARPASLLRALLRAGLDARWALRPFAALLDSVGVSREARAVLTAQWLAYLSPPAHVPVAAHAGYLQNYVGRGAYYPQGGGQVLAARLAEVIRSHGGRIRTGAQVAKILVEHGAVRGVRLSDGEVLPARAVISGADLKRTLLGMVGAEHLPRSLTRRVGGARMSAPFLNVYLGLDIDLSARMPKTNLIAIPSWDDPDQLAREHLQSATAHTRSHWLQSARARLGAFIHCSNVKDPLCPRYAPPGHSALEVMAAVPSDRSFWGACGSGAYADSANYQALKAELIEIMIERAEQALPGVRQHVVLREASTPLTHERFTLSSEGTAYGIELNTAQLIGPPRLRARTPIRGLWIAGASAAWGPGIEGAMLSGMHAASAVLQRDLPRELAAGAVIADRRALPRDAPDWDPLRVSR